ncbi:MAG: hypothetical protein KKE17_07805 [Proteobacteria bacterium]|nr:hypothetical protein [Pseudomonadota bacterium]MBU1709890.1 hypothetical protein [Pseudomonadota bacterium]
MAEKIDKIVERMLQEGLGKPAIWRKLKDREDHQKALFYLNTSSYPADRKKVQFHNLVIAAVLTFITFKKLIVAFSFGVLDLFLFLSLIVPIVNVYVLREVLRFRKIGYQFLFVLSILALVQPENHHWQEASLLFILISISGYMYLTLFPKKAEIKDEEVRQKNDSK